MNFDSISGVAFQCIAPLKATLALAQALEQLAHSRNSRSLHSEKEQNARFGTKSIERSIVLRKMKKKKTDDGARGCFVLPVAPSRRAPLLIRAREGVAKSLL